MEKTFCGYTLRFTPGRDWVLEIIRARTPQTAPLSGQTTGNDVQKDRPRRFIRLKRAVRKSFLVCGMDICALETGARGVRVSPLPRTANRGLRLLWPRGLAETPFIAPKDLLSPQERKQAVEKLYREDLGA